MKSNSAEQIFVWVLQDDLVTYVFLGYDHVRRTSKTYSSNDGAKMVLLAEKIAENSKTSVINNFDATILKA